MLSRMIDYINSTTWIQIVILVLIGIWFGAMFALAI